MATLNDVLAARTREGELYHRLDNEWVHCYACGHNCKIPDGRARCLQSALQRGRAADGAVGLCGRRAVRSDREEAVLPRAPGALAYSFGMLGCDLHCGYCQNWVTSQALRDPRAIAPPIDVTPERLVQDAVAARRNDRRQHLQRAADHERMGGGDFQGSARRRT